MRYSMLLQSAFLLLLGGGTSNDGGLLLGASGPLVISAQSDTTTEATTTTAAEATTTTPSTTASTSAATTTTVGTTTTTTTTTTTAMPVDPTPSPIPPPTPAPASSSPTSSPTSKSTPPPTLYVTPAPTPWGGIRYYSTPPVKWTYKLPGSGANSDPAPRAGNAVTVSPDDKFVYVTTDDGSLTILEAVNGTVWARRKPTRTVTCRGGVSFGYLNGVGTYAVYAVMETVNGARKSRVIAVNHPSGKQMWVSPDLNGDIAGTPMIGRDGRYIYLNRNANIGGGYFTILRVSDGANSAPVFFTESSGQYDKNETGTYAPLALVHEPERGNFNGGQRNRNDVAAWAYMYEGGDNVDGYIKVFQFPSDFNGGDASALRVNTLDKVTWSAVSRPTISPDGLSLYFSLTRSELRGWYDTRWGRGPWKSDLPQDAVNGKLPIPHPPVLSKSGLKLFCASATNSFHGISAVNGTVLWEHFTDSEVIAEPKISPDDGRVYSIQQSDGKVTAHRVLDGSKIWSTNCAKYQNTNPFCQYHVEAEFSLSSTGYYLYYADTRGTVVGLQLGYPIPPTGAPTFKPTANETMVPTFVPTESPRSAPSTSPSSNPTAVPTAAPMPTFQPSAFPTPIEPTTKAPTVTPTEVPTATPSVTPMTGVAEPTLSQPDVTAPPTQFPTEETTDLIVLQEASGGFALLCCTWLVPLLPLTSWFLLV